MNEILILITMIFCHIIDDYTLQGILASMKQKKWWQNNYPDDFYKHDYLVALFMHSFSWSFMIMIAPTLYLLANNNCTNIVLLAFIVNLIIHFCVDDLKANRHLINLVNDQCTHILQILFTWGLLIKIPHSA